MLKLSNKLSLPLDAVTQTFGILAVRGAGKSNTAAVMAEQMFANHLPFVVVDPVGAWWGLRSSSDGKGAGLAIPVFGGLHGDVPLEKTGGVVIADLIVDERLSCVLDCSEFSEGDKIRFLIDFSERLYRRNQDPLHLFLEEADDYCPQRPFREQARLLRNWENVVRRGRSRGLGITMITQRSAALNKNVLTQIETLIVLRTTAPNDRKAIEAWVSYHGQGKELVDSLPTLGPGEAWIWSPSWLKKFDRVQIDRRATFDSGATPKDVKGKRAPTTLADVDLAGITKRMQATIERAKSEDPRELRRRIAELEKQLRERPAVETPEPVRVEVPVFREVDSVRLESLRLTLVDHSSEVALASKQVLEMLESVKNAVSLFQNPITLSSAQRVSKGSQKAPSVSGNGRFVPSKPRIVPPVGAKDFSPSGLSGPEQRILDAIMWSESIDVPEPKQVAVAFLAGYTYGGGAFNNPKGSLRSKGLIEYRGDSIVLTDQGRALARNPGLPLNAEQLHERVLNQLPNPEQRILRPLIAAYPKPLANETLALEAGYTSGAGAFNNPKGRLRSLGLIEYPSPNFAKAAGVLFFE